MASSPPSVTREFAFTSEKPGGSSRGTTALRTTPYAFDATSTPSAAGYSWRLPEITAPDSTRASSARASIADAMAARRPCGTRSSSGPITGASSVNGAIVIARYSATRPRASSVGTEKNTVDARATVIMTSPAPFTACSSISLPSPDSPAPCACVAFRIPRAVPVTGRCRARPTARSGPPVRPVPLRRLLPLAPPVPAGPSGVLAAATPS
ncbi:hypothetical protein SGLAM104S_08178 [Streptomyces glaucescens]